MKCGIPKGRAGRVILSLVVATLCLGSSELVLRALGYRSSPARYFDPHTSYRFFPGQVREMTTPSGASLGQISLNSLGLRGPDPADPKPFGTMRIACLGDSFTFGWGAEDEVTYPAVLRSLLARWAQRQPDAQSYEVLNFGMPGYNTEDELALYRAVVRPSAPDVLVLGFFRNDLEPSFPAPVGASSWMTRTFGNTALFAAWRRHLGLGFMAGRPLVDGPESIARRFNALREDVYGSPTSELATPFVQPCLKALAQLLEEAREDGSQVLLVAFPSRPQVKGPLASSDVPGTVEQLVADVARRQGVPFLDLTTDFRSSSEDPFGSVDLGHPSAAGYRIAAHSIGAELVRLSWL